MKYKVLKEFVSPFTETLMEPSDSIELINFDDDTKEKRYYQNLANYGFIEEIKDGPWEPDYGDEYWYMDEEGEIFCEGKFSRNSVHDDNKLALGNVFQTLEQAEKAIAWLKAFKVLRDDTRGFKPDWSSHEYDKFEVAYEYPHDGMSEGMLFANDCNHCTANIGLWFSSKTDAMNSIKNHRQEWLTFFGVESE